MPRFRQHLAINFAVIAAVDTFCQLQEMEADPNRRFDWLRLATGVTAGCLAGALPDLMEPSIGNPNHRGFCHSLAAAGLAWWLVCGHHSEDWPADMRRLLMLMALGYSSHLTADLLFSRAKGMGFLGPGC